jgi:hypothetical protein
MPILTSPWKKHQALHRAYFEGTAGTEVIWRRLKKNYDRFGEGESRKYQEIKLKVIPGYNDFRTWPTTNFTEAGAVDKESMYLLINRDYLKELGYINSRGNLDFDPVYDKFVLHGLIYKADGDTNIAPSYDQSLYFLLILSRDLIKTGTPAR